MDTANDKIIENENDEAVLSNTEEPIQQPDLPGLEEPRAEKPETPPPEPKEDDKEEKRKRDAFAKRRIEHRRWKEAIATIDDDLAETQKAAVLDLAKAKGFDETDPQTKKQAELMAESQVAQTRIRSQREKEIKRTAATEILAATLTELGYEPGSDGYQLVGQMLFNRVGISDPDVYSRREFVEQEIERINAATSRTKKSDPVHSAVTSKAGSPRPAAESRVRSTPVDDPVKKVAERFGGMSEETAKIIAEKQKNLPSWAK